jgi:hypothetical protein
MYDILSAFELETCGFLQYLCRQYWSLVNNTVREDAVISAHNLFCV